MDVIGTGAERISRPASVRVEETCTQNITDSLCSFSVHYIAHERLSGLSLFTLRM